MALNRRVAGAYPVLKAVRQKATAFIIISLSRIKRHPQNMESQIAAIYERVRNCARWATFLIFSRILLFTPVDGHRHPIL